MQHGYEITKDRFHLLDHSIYYLWGVWPEGYTPCLFLDQKEIRVEMEELNRVSAYELTGEAGGKGGLMVKMEVILPKDLDQYHTFALYAVKGQEREIWYKVSVKQLMKKQTGIQYFFDNIVVDRENDLCILKGWAAATGTLKIDIYDQNDQKLAFELKKNSRLDVSNLFKELKEEETFGFYMDVPIKTAASIKVVFSTDKEQAEKKISLGKGALWAEKAGTYASKGIRYIKAHGIAGFAKKVKKKLKNNRLRPQPYPVWIKKHLPDQKTLEIQKNHHFSIAPKISIVVPLYKTPEKYLLALVESMKKQTYSNWELCLSDGSGADSPLTDLLERLQKEDPRIKVISNNTSLRISENTNAAISIATGDYIAFADHDDELTPHALYECVSAIEKNPTIDVLYSDEDKMSMDSRRFFEPHFKPDYNIDLLCTVNYICHLFVVKRELLTQVGGLRPEYDGAQDYDFIFRCTEQAQQIHHIPKILYHWRCHEDSTAENPESKLYAFEAGARAIQAHYDRIGVPVEITKGEFLGLYRTRFIRSYDPLISIIIPTKDHIDDLKRCIDSIEEKSTYRNYEYIVIENNSTEKETFQFYKELEASNSKVKVVYWDGPFNYSAINNYGIQFAKGEYYLLLNNDTEIINEDCLEELLGYCMRKDVGAVGARLYYDDDTIQHAGVVIGFGGIAGHCFVQQPRGFTGYCHRIICAQDYSAVTAACMMVSRDAFEKVNGLSEELAVAFNDIDFCMKLRTAGYLIVYNPYAELYHYESKSRGQEDTPEKVARFQKEINTFAARWPEILKNGDPFYNPNLTLDSQDFSLKRLD